ncbi:MAG TPA: FAD-dependent monooxygenase [Reyranella sp.]|nr:FAD-dependent monooxygenase [Reyranella sp.]
MTKLYDVIVVGAGLAGSCAASCLARVGYDVALVDRRQNHPAEFRGEQIVGTQVAALARLGVLDHIAAWCMVTSRCEAARRGRIVGRLSEVHYGLPYYAIVEGARRSVPDHVTRYYGNARYLTSSDTTQSLQVGDDTILARLVVLATGLASIDRFGFFRRTIRKDHSLTFGFEVEADYRKVLAYYGERIRDRIDYLTLFPMGVGLRANLFVYRDPCDDWVDNFKRSPNFKLNRCLPGLAAIIGRYHATPPVEARAVSLYQTLKPPIPGIVPIGDAFQTSCPAVGSGFVRVITDVDRLCNLHIPNWLSTPGMGLGKISQYWDDPVKRDVDQEALRSAEYRRNAATETSIGWKLHRHRVHLQQALRRHIGIAPPSSVPPMLIGGVPSGGPVGRFAENKALPTKNG